MIWYLLILAFGSCIVVSKLVSKYNFTQLELTSVVTWSDDVTSVPRFLDKAVHNFCSAYASNYAIFANKIIIVSNTRLL